jgi:hypothetical protein
VHRPSVALVALLLVPGALEAQSIAERVASLGNGTLRLGFAARAGVCGGAGRAITITSGNDRGEWEPSCPPGLVRVSLRVRDGEVAEAHAYVGGRWRPASGPATDLGLVPAARAAGDLLALAERAQPDGEDLVTAAALADSVTTWPALLRLARRSDVPLETRRRAVFWLGEAAGEAATRGLDSLASTDGELEVRKMAVFALSQRPADEGVPALVHIVRTSRHAALRRAALFWLAQSEDARALALFEELLRSP